MKTKSQTLEILIALDQLLNTVFGGDCDEMLSARAFRKAHFDLSNYWNFIKNAIDFVFFWQDNHCYKCFKTEYERRQLSDLYRMEKEKYLETINALENA
jgi:hypothetical protein